MDLKETDGDSQTVSNLLSTIQVKKTEIEIVKESTKTIEEIQISLKSQIEEANAKETILNEKTSDVTEDLEALLEQYQVCFKKSSDSGLHILKTSDIEWPQSIVG